MDTVSAHGLEMQYVQYCVQSSVGTARIARRLSRNVRFRQH